MAKCVTDTSNMAGPAHPAGSIATNGTAPVISTQGHSAKPLDRDGK